MGFFTRAIYINKKDLKIMVWYQRFTKIGMTISVCSSALLLTSIASAALPTCQSPNSDSDGDGYGWENNQSCRVVQTTNNNLGPANVSGITDVIVTAGQSNAVGYASRNNNQSSYDAPNNESSRQRILVWVASNNSWEVANVTAQDIQPWIVNDRGQQSQKGQTHAGYQIAKHLVNGDSSKVVGIIPTGRNGTGIQWFLNNFENHINSPVKNAMAAIRASGSSKRDVDLFWWMQGENDGNYSPYNTRLASLLDKIESQSGNWYNNDLVFVANEIKNANKTVNNAFRELDARNDRAFPTCSNRQNNTWAPDGTHWSAPALVSIGQSVSAKYLNRCNEGSGTPTNSTNCVDTPPVGDGWGWNGVTSCRTQGTRECVDYRPYDGWGWDGVQSCQPVVRRG